MLPRATHQFRQTRIGVVFGLALGGLVLGAATAATGLGDTSLGITTRSAVDTAVEPNLEATTGVDSWTRADLAPSTEGENLGSDGIVNSSASLTGSAKDVGSAQASPAVSMNAIATMTNVLSLDAPGAHLGAESATTLTGKLEVVTQPPTQRAVAISVSEAVEGHGDAVLIATAPRADGAASLAAETATGGTANVAPSSSLSLSGVALSAEASASSNLATGLR